MSSKLRRIEDEAILAYWSNDNQLGDFIMEQVNSLKSNSAPINTEDSNNAY